MEGEVLLKKVFLTLFLSLNLINILRNVLKI